MSEDITPYLAFKPGDMVTARPEYAGFFGDTPRHVTATDGVLVYVEGFSIPWSQDCFIIAPLAKRSRQRSHKPKSAGSIPAGRTKHMSDNQ